MGHHIVLNHSKNRWLDEFSSEMFVMVWLLRKGLEKALHLKSSQLASSQWDLTNKYGDTMVIQMDVMGTFQYLENRTLLKLASGTF